MQPSSSSWRRPFRGSRLSTRGRKRIVFVTNARFTGGTEKQLQQLILRLPLSSIEPTILCYGMDPYSDFLRRKHDLPISVAGGLKANGAVSFWLPFIKYRPEVIVFVNHELGVFPWYAYLAARLAGARRVVAIERVIAAAHENGSGGAARNEGNYERFVGRIRHWLDWQVRYVRRPELMCDKTICVGHAVRDRLIRQYKYPAAKTAVTFNGVDLKQYSARSLGESVRKKLKIGADDDVLVCVTRFDRAKGTDVLLQAMAMVCLEHPMCKCIIVGTGRLEGQLRAMAEELGLTNCVRFVGYVEDVRPYLEGSDIFVLPSRSEGMPLAPLEAMACGLPCIVTDAGGNRGAVRHGQNGLIVKAGSAAELTKAIKYLLRDKEERRRMGENARQKVQADFGIEESMAEMKAILLGS